MSRSSATEVPGQDPISQEHRTLAAETRKLRDARHWSREDLAQRTDIPARSIYRIESMQRKAALDEALAFARAFGVPVETLTRPNQSMVEMHRFEIVAAVRDVRSAVEAMTAALDTVAGLVIDLRAIEPASRNPYNALRDDPASAHRLDVALLAARAWLDGTGASEVTATLSTPESNPDDPNHRSRTLLSDTERKDLLRSLYALAAERVPNDSDEED